MQTKNPQYGLNSMNDLQTIRRKIYEIRSQRVMLDCDMSAISIALSELQASEPRQRERRPIGFVLPGNKDKNTPPPVRG